MYPVWLLALPGLASCIAWSGFSRCLVWLTVLLGLASSVARFRLLCSLVWLLTSGLLRCLVQLPCVA